PHRSAGAVWRRARQTPPSLMSRTTLLIYFLFLRFSIDQPAPARAAQPKVSSGLQASDQARSGRSGIAARPARRSVQNHEGDDLLLLDLLVLVEEGQPRHWERPFCPSYAVRTVSRISELRSSPTLAIRRTLPGSTF